MHHPEIMVLNNLKVISKCVMLEWKEKEQYNNWDNTKTQNTESKHVGNLCSTICDDFIIFHQTKQ